MQFLARQISQKQVHTFEDEPESFVGSCLSLPHLSARIVMRTTERIHGVSLAFDTYSSLEILGDTTIIKQYIFLDKFKICGYKLSSILTYLLKKIRNVY